MIEANSLIYKICAYITAYQDNDAVITCVNSLKNQTYPIDKIFIIDNSKISELVVTYHDSDFVIVEHHPENIGIASGLNIGVSWAINEGYDFIWTFDQDSQPSPETLEALLFYFSKLHSNDEPIGIIAPVSIDKKSNQELEGALFGQYHFVPISSYFNKNLREFYNRDYYDCDIVITSGSLVNLKAAKNVALPNKDLFIDSVDWDYCMKFRDAGYRVVVASSAVMIHNFGNYVTEHQNFNKTTMPVYNYSPLRYYYTSRNHTYIETRLAYRHKALWLSVLFRCKRLLKNIIKIVLYEPDQKISKVCACFIGTCHGFIARLGKA